MIELDGRDGGGQYLRSALTLSALVGESFHMTDIRARRPQPGLRPQHRAAVGLMADVCNATVSAVEVGSTELTFEPGAVTGDRIAVNIGTAGAVTLVCDTALPIASILEDPIVVSVAGGTNVKWSPTSAHHRHVKLPLLRRQGVHCSMDVARHGFHPAGGGRATLHLAPSDVTPIALPSRDSIDGARVYSLASFELASARVAERQAEAAVDGLAALDLEVLERRVTYCATDCPGSAITIRLEGGFAIAGFDAVGERGLPAEDVAGRAVKSLQGYVDSSAAVDEHTGDQLMPFLAMAGGEIYVPSLTDHIESHRGLIEAFGIEIVVESLPDAVRLYAPGVTGD